jgi:hypothetical protein
VTLLVLFRVAVDETIDTSSTEGSCCDSLTFGASPGPGDIATAEGFDSTGYYGGFGGLLPLLRLATSTTAAARPRAVATAAAIVVIIAAVAVVATVVAASVS